MEYCDAGSTLDLMTQLKKPFPEEAIAVIIKQVLNALSYLHHMKPPTIHRDIKV
jgi:serine/threonine protein kinase